MPVYLDNACTSSPKPSCVCEAVASYLSGTAVNINRSGYADAFKVEDEVFECRELLAELFGAHDPRNVIFTRGVTESLNLVLKGLLKSGDHVVVSSMEHNAVMRPLCQLAENGIEFTRVRCADDGSLNPDDVKRAITPDTRLVVMTHASNVCGTLLPLAQVGEICSKAGVLFAIDTAQTAGVLPITMGELHADALCFTGHKGLMGPQGIGGVVLSERMAHELEPLVAGGTGSASDSEYIPEYLPDKFEAGTLNLPGIMGLKAALKWLKQTGISTIYEHEIKLIERFLQGVLTLEQQGMLRVCGRRTAEDRVGVVSIVPANMDPAACAHALANDYGIQTRVGLHCAPSAHKTLGTFPTGTVRFSFGYANTVQEIDSVLNALETLLARQTDASS